MKIKALVICVAIASSIGAAAAQQTTTVQIGLVGPLSGTGAAYGKDIRNAAMLAIDDLNAQAIVIDGKRVTFTLDVEDDAADPKQGVAVAQKLCDSKVAAVVGHVNSGTAIPAARVYDDCSIPFLSAGATNPKLTQLGYKYTYRLLANDNALAKGVAAYAASTLKLKRVAVIDDRSAYGQGVAEVFKREAKAAGMEIVSEQFVSTSVLDFNAILTAIKSKNAEAIFFGGADPQAGPMLRQIDQLGMTSVRYLGGDGICTDQLATNAAGTPALSKVICAEGGISIAKMPKGPEWKKRYDEKFPGEFQLFAPYAYDGVMVVGDAIKRAKSIDPAVFRKAFATTDYRGVTTTVQFDGTGELKNGAITLYTFTKGVRTPIN